MSRDRGPHYSGEVFISYSSSLRRLLGWNDDGTHFFGASQYPGTGLYPQDAAFEDVRVTEYILLQLFGVDVLATAENDQIFLATGDKQVADENLSRVMRTAIFRL